MPGTICIRSRNYEKAHRRPPLTALVVRKQGGRPGEGFATVAYHIHRRRPSEVPKRTSDINSIM